MLKRIGEVVHDSTRFLKGALGMRTQKCFAVKVISFSTCYSMKTSDFIVIINCYYAAYTT